MYSVEVADIAASLASAKNANSAIKHFLKREVRSGDKGERFAKDLRALVPFKNRERLERFIEASLPQFEMHLIVLMRYAYAEELGKLVEKLFDRYADAFNATYKKESEGVTVTDKAGFEKIVGNVLNDIPQLLTEHQLPTSGYIRNVVLFVTFEQEVLKHIAPIIRAQVAGTEKSAGALA